MKILPAIIAGLFFILTLRAETDQEAFRSSQKSFQDGFYARSEKELGDFLAKFPNSEYVPDAVLILVQARFYQQKYDSAIQLLKERLKPNARNRDQLQFWLAENYFQKQMYKEAFDLYSACLKEYPESSARLPAAYGQALCRFKMGDVSGSIDLLQKPEGDFQQAVASKPNDLVAVHGFFLLGEGYFRQHEYAKAKAILQQLSKSTLKPELEWDRQFLLARIDQADGHPEQALGLSTNLITTATNLNVSGLATKALNLQAELYQQVNKPEQAAAVYQRLALVEASNLDEKRNAILKMAQALVSANEFTNAIQNLQLYTTANTNEAASDLIQLTLGELYLKEFYHIAKRTNSPALPVLQTNLLSQAQSYFDQLLRGTNSTFLGKGFLDLGWVFWEKRNFNEPARISDSLAAFANASSLLPHSLDRAVARMKWADCLFELQSFPAAVTNYQIVVDGFTDLPEVKVNLQNQALYQILRSYLALGNQDKAEQTLQVLQTQFPLDFLTERGLLLFANFQQEKQQTTQARETLQKFQKLYPKSSLMPEAELALARTYSLDQNWENAILLYSQWLTNHPLSADIPLAQFNLGWSYYQSGQDTNAYALFTNLVSRFPSHFLAPKAQTWVGDYYLRQENWKQAEQSYQMVFQNTNWIGAELSYQARLMAARAALFRQGYSDAKSYLTNLVQDPKCPPSVAPEAWFVLGDLFLEQSSTDSTNSLAHFSEALNVFTIITKQYPTNTLAPLAWGKIGDCHVQLATQFPNSYEKATNAYDQVLQSKWADLPVAALNQAEVGMGVVLEKMAESKTGLDKVPILTMALDHYLNVVYGRNSAGRDPDPVWLKKAALSATRLAESLNLKNEASNLYRRLMTVVPAMRSTWAKKLEALD